MEIKVVSGIGGYTLVGDEANGVDMENCVLKEKGESIVKGVGHGKVRISF